MQQNYLGGLLKHTLLGPTPSGPFSSFGEWLRISFVTSLQVMLLLLVWDHISHLT